MVSVITWKPIKFSQKITKKIIPTLIGGLFAVMKKTDRGELVESTRIISFLCAVGADYMKRHEIKVDYIINTHFLLSVCFASSVACAFSGQLHFTTVVLS